MIFVDICMLTRTSQGDQLGVIECVDAVVVALGKFTGLLPTDAQVCYVLVVLVV
jgi:hypothetical protein